jgi:DNA polymerase delta subunit 4
MPPKRRTSGPATKAQQSTLAFHGSTNKVTKFTTKAQNGKKSVLSKSAPKSVEPTIAEIDAIEELKPTTVEADIINQVKEDVATEGTPEEEAAKRITDTAIKNYWTSKERQRLASRVHQQDLSVYEKVLREFDVSGQYGVSAHGGMLWLFCALNMADMIYNL